MPGSQRQRGVALAMLLWMMAGLSLLVSGTIYVSRTDVQLTSLQLEQARAQAAAIGAGHLLMRDLLISQSQMQQPDNAAMQTTLFTRQYQLGELTAVASARPTSGFISLNAAPVALLADLFLYAGGLSQDDALLLAEQVELWRTAVAPQDFSQPELPQVSGQFAVLEDLLRVPGMTRLVYERVSPALTVVGAGSPGVNPAAAGPIALLALTRGDQELVDFIQESRQDERPEPGAATAGMEPSYLTQDSSPIYSVEIDVMTSANRVFHQRIWVETGSGAGLPWRFIRVMPIAMRPGNQGGNRDAR